VKVPGVGTGGFPIATRSVAAQGWFDYGMALAGAFYHADAVAAFRRARDLDPACAMCAWGEAWAEGPTVNFDVSADVRREAGDLLVRASSLASTEAAKNRELIAALRQRYAGAPREADLAYATAMDALSRRYPHDNAIAVLNSDAWLELYTIWSDRRGVNRAVELLRPVLWRSPGDTAAIHFYIHATEFAGEPGRAEPYADRIGALAPGASHLVHMASHTFFRVGRYEDAAVANARAIAADGAYMRATHDGRPQGAVLYHAHDVRFGLAGAMAAGDGPLAVRLADHAAFAFPAALATDSVARGALGAAAMAYGRYAPERALRMAPPGPAQPYLAVLRHYARGEAFAARGDLSAVGREADALDAAFEQAERTADRLVGRERAVARIARLTLRGRAAMIAGRPQAAAAAFRAAAGIQDQDLSGLWDFDPPPWWYPERRSLAAALLAAGEPAEAAAEARAALARWPRDPLTLQVLGRAETALGDSEAGRRDIASAAGAWRGPAVDLARI
jgi:tetratricopeptide (TPR) repeat protein